MILAFPVHAGQETELERLFRRGLSRYTLLLDALNPEPYTPLFLPLCIVCGSESMAQQIHDHVAVPKLTWKPT